MVKESSLIGVNVGCRGHRKGGWSELWRRDVSRCLISEQLLLGVYLRCRAARVTWSERWHSRTADRGG